jgi:hypothetical protein
MLCTIKEDSMGCLHVWEGESTPVGYKYTWHADGRESDLFIQNDYDVQSFLDNLTCDERDQIELGYFVTTRNVPSDYFTNE